MKRGYILVYSLMALMVGSLLIAGIVKVGTSYCKSEDSAFGVSGAVYASESGLSLLKGYVNKEFDTVQAKNHFTSNEEVQLAAQSLLSDILTKTSAESTTGGTLKARKLLEGYSNYDVENLKDPLRDKVNRKKGTSIAYSVYVATNDIVGVESNGILNVLIVGEYTYNNKVYTHELTYKLHADTKKVKTKDGNKYVIYLNILDYYDGIKGGKDSWGEIKLN